jgi:hypothetical protein
MLENILELRIKSGHVLIDWAESQIGESGKVEKRSHVTRLHTPLGGDGRGGGEGVGEAPC